MLMLNANPNVYVNININMNMKYEMTQISNFYHVEGSLGGSWDLSLWLKTSVPLRSAQTCLTFITPSQSLPGATVIGLSAFAASTQTKES